MNYFMITNFYLQIIIALPQNLSTVSIPQVHPVPAIQKCINRKLENKCS